MHYVSCRQMDGAKIECKANNTLVSNPTIRSLDLEMYLRPLRADVKMTESMEEQRRYKARCIVFGSKPPPVIQWYMNGEKLDSVEYPTVRIYEIKKESAKKYPTRIFSPNHPSFFPLPTISLVGRICIGCLMTLLFSLGNIYTGIY